MKNVALYVRVSTAEQKQHGLSVDSQIEALKDYSLEHGYNIVGIYNDAGYSARKSYKQRPALLTMVNDCKLHRIDMILFTKLDRFFRSVKDYYSVMEQIGDIPWRAIWEDYETETSSGIFKVNIMLSVAQSEADRTSERIKSIMEYKRSKGDYVGQAPVGYKREGNHLVKDPAAAPGITKFFRAYLDNKPLSQCVSEAAALGVHISRNNAYKILDSTTYMGDAYGTVCEAYITSEEHDRILARKSDYIRAARIDRVYTFHGLVYCGYCGRRLACSARKRNSKVRGNYIQMVYQCRNSISDFKHEPCTGCGINEEILEDLVLKQIEEDVTAYNFHISKSETKSESDAAKKQIISLEQKLKRIGERYEDGDISAEEYKSKRDPIKSEISRLKVIAEQTREPIVLPDGWRELYDDLSAENRRIFGQEP